MSLRLANSVASDGYRALIPLNTQSFVEQRACQFANCDESKTSRSAMYRFRQNVLTSPDKMSGQIASGSHTVNVLPEPTRLSAVICPP